ncbi:NAD(P)H-binding protein [Saccharomonospora sp. NPDC046836]|uniref:NAD(P)H-binding protein n=1 Tax=Saccharomonospora sp. NPDC046836 TaxID=3156921 RepID=UPI0033F8615D
MTILVTGATGNIGRMVVDQLLARGERHIRALTNNPVKAALPPTVEVAEGYLRRVDTLPAAFKGVSKVYLAPTPETVQEVLRLAREAGVQHIVDLSGEPDSWWGTVNTAVEESGLAWTHLWPGDFMENSLMWAEQIRRTGAVREPNPDAASAPIAMDDIAAVAATALLDDTHRGRAYSLTGPETLTRTQLLASISAALGRDIPFVTATPAETVAALAPAMGENTEWYVNNVLALFDNGGLHANRAVEDITGRPATRFADWARTHAGEFS